MGMTGRQELHARAVEEFGGRVELIRADQWELPTPCREWTVRDLVGHLVYEQLWVPPLLAGSTIEEVGDRYDGDQLGDDPRGAWKRAAGAALEAVAAAEDLGDFDVHLSYGSKSADHYVGELTSDLAVHAWDLARAIGADDTLDPALVEAVAASTPSGGPGPAAIFDPPVPVPPGAGAQDRLIALYGRQP
jgi:uncharacterized protein (TIGR03086 family)